MEDRDLAGGDQVRRWSLLAQLTEALEAWDGDYQKLSYSVADLIAEQIGDRAAVVLVDPPGHSSPVVSVAYRNASSEGMADALLRELGDDGIRAWVREFSDSDDRLEDSLLRPLDHRTVEPQHREVLRGYMDGTRISDWTTAPLRTLSGKIRGLIVCNRDAGSKRFDAFDRAVLASAADTIGLGLDLAAAHAQVRRAAAEAYVFSSLAHSSPDFVAIADNDGRVTFLNEAGRKLVGVPSEVEVTDTMASDYQVISDDRPGEQDVKDWLPVVVPYWSGRGALRDWRGGAPIPVSVRSFWVYDDQSGERLGVASVQRDMRKELEAQGSIEQLAEQRRVLLGQLVNAEQVERQRIAQEVHDEAMQWLAAGQLRLQVLANQLAAGDLGAAVRSADDVSDLVSSAQSHLRQLLLDLEPPAAANRELHEALVDTAKKFFTDTDTKVTVTGALTGVPRDVAAVFYRSAREAVINARRHAHAKHVDVTLSEDDAYWRLLVSDDGIGMPRTLAIAPGHLGLRGMIGRAEALGGTCAVRRGAKHGTEVLITIPK